jgi:hypothetical protein
MKLEKIYFKVEAKISCENSNCIEKHFFNTKAFAEDKFKKIFCELEMGFLQNRIKEYSLVLAECDSDNNLTRIHKIRKAPL